MPLRRGVVVLLASLVAAMTLAVWQSARPAQGATAAEQQAFIQEMLPGAVQGWQEFGVPVSVTISQAILESGWGGSQLSKQYNAYFGIKCVPGGSVSPYQSGCVGMQTQEYVYGSWTTVTAYFRSYASATDSLADHGYYLKNRGIYNAAFTVNADPRLFAQEIQRGGYATDPNYAYLLYRIMVSNNLFQYDQGTRIGQAIRPSATMVGRLSVPTQSQSTPVQSAPVQSTPVQSTPVQSTPVQSTRPSTASPSSARSDTTPSASTSAGPSASTTSTTAGIVLEKPPLARQQPQDPQIVHPAMIHALPQGVDSAPTPSTPSNRTPSTDPADRPAAAGGATTAPQRTSRPIGLPSTGD
ncbi:glucosaminidase domain-containing protein [Aestuariimicrobium sp. T2.26MG-19.2B]|uniref:glucosaminidase domain-containing protein n=1 Tax=Aestuariimicrobium sp. T2.26MG-19.2B TaxID=3040679 RepID=UPI0025407EFF|nr:glucosaminidase domain-containing protein [Aestuariimicrobium sp. T2.26MG-19.2B]